MAGQKLTAAQQRRIDQIQEYQRIVAHARTLVTELESSRAARPIVIENLCSQIAREMSQLRYKCLTTPVGTVGDTAGALAVMAGRGGGINMKLRGLADGLNGITMQLDQALKLAHTPEAKTPPAGGTPGADAPGA